MDKEMNNYLPNSEDDEFGKDSDFEIPQKTKNWFNIIFGILLFLIICLYVYLIVCNPQYIEPAKFGLPELLIGCMIILSIINIPWSELGFRVKKIGIIELEQVVKGQAKSNSDELADLQKQIDILNQRINNKQNESTETITTNAGSTEKEIDRLVYEFLCNYKEWAFSALRIHNWGGKRLDLRS